jgi:predicted ATPase
MAPEEIAGRLGDRFALLSAGRGALERHRTLQAAVAWSYELLGNVERRVFRRLAVFPASFDLAAASAVGGGGGDVVDCVVGLGERSLVVYEPARAAIGCWKRCASMPPTGWRRPTRPTPPGTVMPPTTPPWPPKAGKASTWSWTI